MKYRFFYIFIIILSSCISRPELNKPIIDEIESTAMGIKVLRWEDGIRTDPAENTFEWWYFDASFTDGSTAVIVFSTKNILRPGGKADPGVSIVITTGKGNKITVSDNPGMENFMASRETVDVQIGNSYVRGDLSQCIIHFEKDEIEADLILTSEAPSWRPGSGKIYFDQEKKDYFAWLAAIPYGRIEGSLTYNGEKIDVTGTGYHDHNWGNVRLDKVMTQWYWGRADCASAAWPGRLWQRKVRWQGALIHLAWLEMNGWLSRPGGLGGGRQQRRF